MSSHDRLRIRSLKFLTVGATNTALNYIIYVVLIYLGLHYNLALTIDYAIGILFGYYLNRYWTFAGREEIQNSFKKYFATYIAVYIVNMVSLNLIMKFTNLGPLWGQVIALTIATVFSFGFQNYWVFRSGKKSIQRQTH